ncbi:hypothetical protein [Vibrio penaeicida]|uniref:Uncharacterized protein n=1 Tax=Vibrio penaeicida TaxID=104609 RepID=A0AAV5NXS1_9VIBR|nr:hypothetical protein [Vibrio penaeicida]RTZ20825.1 hypothetical protein EKN09_22460 [Vibrio penaeicida]GLQ75354.1 hypothetical protein GCM10007932_47160 [Vibrio penaeicida]
MRYRVDISQNNTALFSIHIEALSQAACKEKLEIALEAFPVTAGFERQVFVSDSEERILKSANSRIEVLAINPVYQPLGSM